MPSGVQSSTSRSPTGSISPVTGVGAPGAKREHRRRRLRGLELPVGKTDGSDERCRPDWALADRPTEPAQRARRRRSRGEPRSHRRSTAASRRSRASPGPRRPARGSDGTAAAVKRSAGGWSATEANPISSGLARDVLDRDRPRGAPGLAAGAAEPQRRRLDDELGFRGGSRVDETRALAGHGCRRPKRPTPTRTALSSLGLRSGRACATSAAAPATTAAAALEPVAVAKRARSLRPGRASIGREAHSGRDDVRPHPPIECESSRGEGRDTAGGPVSDRAGRVERDRDLVAVAQAVHGFAPGWACNGDHGQSSALVEVEGAGGQICAVDEQRGRARGLRVRRLAGERRAVRGDERGAAGYATDAVRVEEVAELDPPGLRVGRGVVNRRARVRGGRTRRGSGPSPFGRRPGCGQARRRRFRLLRISLACASKTARRVSSAPTLKRVGRGARGADAAEAEAGVPVVSGRRDDEGPEIACARDGAGLGAVREGGERLDHRREGDLAPHRSWRRRRSGRPRARGPRSAGRRAPRSPCLPRSCCQPRTRNGTMRAPGATRRASPAIRVPWVSSRPCPSGLGSGAASRLRRRSHEPVPHSAAETGPGGDRPPCPGARSHAPAVESAQRDSGRAPAAAPRLSVLRPDTPPGRDRSPRRADCARARRPPGRRGCAEKPLSTWVKTSRGWMATPRSRSEARRRVLHRLDVRNPLLLIRGRRPFDAAARSGPRPRARRGSTIAARADLGLRAVPEDGVPRAGRGACGRLACSLHRAGEKESRGDRRDSGRASDVRASSGRRRIRIERKILRIGDGCGIPGRGGDHHCVIGAELERRESRVRKRRPELRVRGHAADDGDSLECRPAPPLRSSARRGRGRSPADSSRRGRRAARSSSSALQVPNGVEQGGLQPGEGEVQARDARDRKAVGLRVSLAGEPVDRRTAGVAEPE